MGTILSDFEVGGQEYSKAERPKWEGRWTTSNNGRIGTNKGYFGDKVAILTSGRGARQRNEASVTCLSTHPKNLPSLPTPSFGPLS